MSSSTISVGSPWSPYGLRDDPFFQQALQPRTDSTAARPTSLHVGRDDELRLLANQVVGSSTSRAIVQGDAGVGKTSFVSALKTAVAPHGVLTHEAPVRVQFGMTPREFIGEVLKVLLQIRGTEVAALQHGTARRIETPSSASAAEAQFWRRLARIVDGEDSLAGGATLGIIGVQQERIRIPSELTTGSLFGELEQALSYLAHGGARRILIHVNNMEGLRGAEAHVAADLMQQLRDAFLFDHGHWLFVGTTGIEDEIFRVHAQVGGIIPITVTLGPLLPDEVATLIEKRYTHLRHTGFGFTRPIAAADATALYSRYHGHLRDFLRLLSGAVQRHAVSASGESLTRAQVVHTMAPLYLREGLMRRISTDDTAALAATMSGQAFDAEFRVADITERASTTQPRASRLLERMVAAGVVHETRSHGRSVYYRISHGDDTVALGVV
jgi:MarR family